MRLKNKNLILAVILGLGFIALLIFWQDRQTFISNQFRGQSTPAEAVTIVVENLEIPWDIAFLPGGDLLVTERTGRLTRISSSGERVEIPINRVKSKGEGGLLGLVLHPDFSRNHLLYLYLTAPGEEGQTENRVERYRLEGNKLVDEKLIIGNIPGALYHDGGRMEFGPDGLLYITTGDATKENLAQDRNSLAGKILRLKDDGQVPEDNPFGTPVYSYGHRNPQGLAWDDEGRLWATEHGRSGLLSGLDEINLVQKGLNYGWPEIQGEETAPDMVSPVLQSGSDVTWAPASLTYFKGRLFFGGLRGEALYEARLEGNQIAELKVHFKGEFGRIRTVRLGLDKMLYLTTSNRDGRGRPGAGDDKIIKISPAALD
ncbi:MAG: PQQ-dependent sugar dehydrogenase [Candidatus Colwellbacteria bacterium]|nr:PQQ-dependent sugar dehydrogenase [Candidatus Colwellbacteria bacterium]